MLGIFSVDKSLRHDKDSEFATNNSVYFFSFLKKIPIIFVSKNFFNKKYLRIVFRIQMMYAPANVD